MGVGLAQGAYDLAAAYARDRQQFGKPIGSFQAVQFRLADMATEIAAGRQLVYKAAWVKDQGRDFARDAAMAKLYTGEMSNRVVNWALQLRTGYGYMDEFAISRLYRDQKILEIGEGTNEVQRMVIARLLGFDSPAGVVCLPAAAARGGSRPAAARPVDESARRFDTQGQTLALRPRPTRPWTRHSTSRRSRNAPAQRCTQVAGLRLAALAEPPRYLWTNRHEAATRRDRPWIFGHGPRGHGSPG